MKSFINKQFTSFGGLNISIFRFLFGLVIFWEMGRLVIWKDYIWHKYINTVFNFKFPFFEWIEVASPNVMYLIIWGTAVLSLLFAFGLFHRVVAPVLFISYSYLEMIDVSYWNNHYYFYMLFLFLFIFIPPSTSIYKLLKKDYTLESNFYWQQNILKFVVVLVLFYGGVSKIINPDWMSGRACDYLLDLELGKKGIDASQTMRDIGSWLMTWVGLFFDLLGGFLLLNRRTFWIGMLFFVPFNLTNSFLFNIGSFPYAMLSTSLLFLPVVYWTKLNALFTPISREQINDKPMKAFLASFIVIQLLIPLRHFMIDGNVIWTGEAKLYSWHMMSAATSVKVEKFYIKAIPPDGEEQLLYPIQLDQYLNVEQIRNFAKFPILAPQFAHFAKEEMEIDGYTQVEVYGEIYCSKNGKPLKPIIDPYVDLTKVSVKYSEHNEWILLYLDEGL